MSRAGSSLDTTSSFFHSKLCTMREIINNISMSPREIPGQILLPAPKGMNFAFLVPVKSTSVCKNLSGLNFKGSVHAFGSV
ncbi:hypothetical protein Mapa_007379 [Marchantia paleacea]|nr:hypothetical protein Mapa_007379 [Marchantia paleacea]